MHGLHMGSHKLQQVAEFIFAKEKAHTHQHHHNFKEHQHESHHHPILTAIKRFNEEDKAPNNGKHNTIQFKLDKHFALDMPIPKPNWFPLELNYCIDAIVYKNPYLTKDTPPPRVA